MMDEQPLQTLLPDGGLCGIFRTIGCIGDSLSSGEHESTKEDGTNGYHDYYEYSWGQYIARTIGAKVYNFSRGGMTAKWYLDWSEQEGFWKPEFACQAYILALGVNDMNQKELPVGQVGDGPESGTFAGYYGEILGKIRLQQPKARVFLMTMPTEPNQDPAAKERFDQHREMLLAFAQREEFTYVLDFRQYAPVYDQDFKRAYYLGGHLNAVGYLMTAKFVLSYMDWIIRHHMEDFVQVGFIGREGNLHNANAKW